MTTHLPIFGVPPHVRALLLGTPPYAGSLPRDLYAALAYFYPGVLSPDPDDLLLQCGGSRVLTELVWSLWATCGHALDDIHGVGGREFPGRVATASGELHRLLDARAAEDHDLDLAFDTVDAVLLLRDRLDTLLSLAGNRLAVSRMPALLWREAGRQNKPDQGGLMETAVGASLLGAKVNLRRRRDGLATPFAEWRDYGRAILSRHAYAPQNAQAAPEAAGLKRSLKARRPPAAEPGSAVLFPSSILEGVGRSDNQKELRRILADVLDEPLPGVPVPADWDAWERALLARHPNGRAFFRAIRRSQGSREFWGHAVVCADGPPGAGKSAMCRSVAEISRIPMKRFQCDNAADNSYGGTPIRWNSAQLDFLTAAFIEFKSRTFSAVLEEVEKAGGSRETNSGKLHDVLLGQWEPETAKAWPSTFLCAPVDLTGVVFLCTANEAANLPAPLRDRMVVARVEEPTADHLGTLAPQIAREVCRRQGLDERWGALDAVEMASLAEAWPGGSIRRLVRLVEVVLQARDEGPAAAPRH
ncbi:MULTISPECIES: AAA family ATPase [unclassified Methylobacterium]|jgi:ATP-dependent Lon protease|uniref:AAA family ATPase n=1 Tax=unclassified Methylobacterium TaxID=2615210 RepID=UPI0006900F6E|nr:MULTISPECIES: AAA family ATPase [unclassified Methylobacterium]SFU94254.1 ATPase family associated with various cellular activities (AAA) [Methylobacterium sp. UNCCL125]